MDHINPDPERPQMAAPDSDVRLDRSAMVDQIADMLISRARHPLGMAGVMLDAEVAAGRQPIQPGAREPFHFPAADWSFPQIVSLDGGEVRLIAINADRPGSGALTRLLANICAAGLRPVIVAPVGLAMPAILARWGWVETVIGEGWGRVDEWRQPNVRSPSATITDDGQASGMNP